MVVEPSEVLAIASEFAPSSARDYPRNGWRSRQDLNRNPLIRSQMLYPVEVRDRDHAASRSLRSEPDCTIRIWSAA